MHVTFVCYSKVRPGIGEDASRKGSSDGPIRRAEEGKNSCGVGLKCRADGLAGARAGGTSYGDLGPVFS